MAKKLYHLPLQQIKTFLSHQKSTIRSDIKKQQKIRIRQTLWQCFVSFRSRIFYLLFKNRKKP
jgi:hypothetical protein